MTASQAPPGRIGRLAELARFAVVGGFAAIANIVARVVLQNLMPFVSAVAVAYLVGMAIAYALSRLFVFQPSGRSVRSEALRFAAVNMASLCIVWGVSVGLADIFFPAVNFVWNAELVAHAVGVASPILLSYYAHRFFTFRRAD